METSDRNDSTKSIPAINGPVATDALGATLMHEHVFVLTPALQVAYPGFRGWDPDVQIPAARRYLTELVGAGIDTIVDVTTVDTGRDVSHVLRAAEGTGLQIVVATGMQTERHLPRALSDEARYPTPRTPEELDELFMRDATVGVQGTDVKAGIIKCASDLAGLTPDVERVLRASARVQVETGLPITTHTHAQARTGFDQQRVLAEEGADLERVVIGHSGDTTDLDYLERLIAAGSIVGMDRFGEAGAMLVSLDERVDTIVSLCERGYADRIVISHDHCCYVDWVPRDQAPSPDGHQYISRAVLPRMRERGVTDEQIRQMLVDTPRRLFEGRAS